MPGWGDRGEGPSGAEGASAPGAIDVSAFASVEELETLGARLIWHCLLISACRWGFGTFSVGSLRPIRPHQMPSEGTTGGGSARKAVQHHTQWLIGVP